MLTPPPPKEIVGISLKRHSLTSKLGRECLVSSIWAAIRVWCEVNPHHSFQNSTDDIASGWPLTCGCMGIDHNIWVQALCVCEREREREVEVHEHLLYISWGDPSDELVWRNWTGADLVHLLLLPSYLKLGFLFLSGLKVKLSHIHIVVQTHTQYYSTVHTTSAVPKCQRHYPWVVQTLSWALNLVLDGPVTSHVGVIC